MGCDQVRELVAELAIGIADGRERDAAMRHAVTCPGCRQLRGVTSPSCHYCGSRAAVTEDA